MELLIPLASSGILDRLQSNWWRLAITLAVAVTVLVVMIQSVKSRIPAIIASFGAAWVTWQVWNLVSGSKTHLLPGEPRISELPKLYTEQGWPLVLAVLAIPAAIGVYLATSKTQENEDVPLWLRLIVVISVWFAFLLIISMVRNLVS